MAHKHLVLQGAKGSLDTACGRKMVGMNKLLGKRRLDRFLVCYCLEKSELIVCQPRTIVSNVTVGNPVSWSNVTAGLQALKNS